MSFISVVFFLCLFVAATIFYQIPARWRTLYMLALSYAFYATWSLPYLVLLVLASSIAFGAGFLIVRFKSEGWKQTVLWAAIGLILASIVGFKLAGQITGLLFPLGLSYYSFKLIAYLAEVYWDESSLETDFATFYLYPAFFPQIVSGPIQRPLDFFEQWRENGLGKANYTEINSGYRFILSGLMLKLLIGDRLGSFIQIVGPNPSGFTWPIIAVAVLCYTLQLYADFAGYTSIALGVGKMFGVQGPPNFNAPFLAPNIAEMWRRWHISLTSWLTDYVFTPLSLAFRDYGRVGLYAAISVNMIAVGVWHGLTWNYFIFGVWQAVFVVLTIMTAPWRKKIIGTSRIRRWASQGLGMALTFLLMSFTQIFWRAETVPQALNMLGLVSGVFSAGGSSWGAIKPEILTPLPYCMAVAWYNGLGSPGWRFVSHWVRRFVPHSLIYAVILMLIFLLRSQEGGKFIYGQF